MWRTTFIMAKALFGHVGGSDLHFASEVARLRRRVADLEAEIGRLQERNDELEAAHVQAEIERTLVGEPVGV